MIDLIKFKNGSLITLEDLPEEMQKQIKNFAMLHLLKDQAQEEIKAKAIDINEHVQQWLQLQKSEHTSTAYKIAINDWFRFLKKTEVKHPLMAKAENADSWVLELKEKSFSANTIRLKARAVSSFYTLLRRYRHVSFNPFLGVPLPQKQYKKAVDPDDEKTIPIMNKDEYTEIKKELESRIKRRGKHVSIRYAREGAKVLLPIVHFLGEYGIRVGAIPTIKIIGDYFSFITKGNKHQKLKLNQVTKEIIEKFRLSKKPFNNVKISTIKKAVERLTKKLCDENRIRYPYSSHDFRHYFSTLFYQEEKDIVKLKEMLGHASINVTDIYLQSINIK